MALGAGTFGAIGGAVSDLFAAKTIESVTEAITVVRRGKHSEIVGHKLRAKVAVGDVE